MIAKEKFNTQFKIEDDCSGKLREASSNLSSEQLYDFGGTGIEVSNDCSDIKNLDMLWEEQSGNMVYNYKSKTFDLGNLRATNYKHNKITFMPKADKVDRESSHEFRRVEMRKIFDKVLNESTPPPIEPV